MDYKYEVLRTRYFGDSKENVFKLTKKGETPMKISEIRNIVTQFEKRAKQEKKKLKLMIRILSIDKWHTVKRYSDQDVEIEEYEDYFGDRVADPKKFEGIYQVEIISMTTPMKPKKKSDYFS